MKGGNPKSQEPVASAFVHSILCIIRRTYGEEQMLVVMHHPEAFARSPHFKQAIRDSSAEVAAAGWQEGAADAGDSDRYRRVQGHYTLHGAAPGGAEPISTVHSELCTSSQPVPHRTSTGGFAGARVGY